MTEQMRAVLGVLLDVHRADPNREIYGLQLCQELGLGFSTVYRILGRLHDESGWVDRRDENVGSQRIRRAPRVYFRLNDDGAHFASQALGGHREADQYGDRCS
jgi:PadR family transcriptional regulator PadR